MKRSHRKRRGVAIAYIVVGLTVFIGFVSLAIDVSHVRLVRIQLQCAADAAARAGAENLQTSVSAAQTAAVNAAAANSADGRSVVVSSTNDIDIGTWANGSFTVLTGSAQSGANGVRVRCSRTSAKGNAVSIYFGSVLGIISRDVTVQATATGSPTPPAGFIGYTAVTGKNNTFFGGYNSSVSTAPTQNGADKNMRVGSNGAIDAKNNDQIYGDVVLGPSATATGFVVSGSRIQQTTALTVESLPTWSPQTNPGSIPQAYTVSSNTTLAAGTYWFTSLTVNANLTFSGASIIYVNGPISVDATLTAASGIPSDLTIYQYGANTFGDGSSNGMSITACVLAPGCDFTSKNNLYFAGSGIFNTITTKNNANFFYDEALGPYNGSYAVATVD